MISENKYCPIVFVTSFLNVVGAYIKIKSISMKWGDKMVNLPFSSVLSKPYEEESRDNEEPELNQLAKIHPKHQRTKLNGY